MKTLSIDIETYSSAELAKCGVYKYTEAPDFEILLFGYSVDGGPVKVVDLAMGETIPPEIIFALTDDSVTKWAFNAQFERVCLSRWLLGHGSFDNGSYCMPGDTVGNYLNPASWRCTMIWSAYMGLPLSLEGVGAVLGLEKQKLTEGKDLIKYFCQPCAPTKSNGGRTRNLPKDAPEKWATFKKYNIRDVEVELSIQRKLAKFPVPDMVWDQYHLDQKINDRGVKLDMVLVRQAIEMDTRSRGELTEAMKNLTALENPNSVQQMKQWLSDNGVDASSLGKKEVSEMVKTAPPELKSVLLLRQQLAKSSVKKYQAMEKAVCADGRARGMFQFYGANRTGRFCGRIIQMQNLPQNHLPDLAEARALVRSGNYDGVKMLYEDVPDTLSQLIRTAFIPKPGCRFIVSDFSAIEARVLAWLAGETWRQKVFEEGRDIYCESASRMFKVPVEKHGQNAHLRQKGKQAELACIAEGQLVLTNHGLIPIESVSTDDLLWDGENWVRHEGVIFKGEREVITYEGLTATEDHLVWVRGQSQPVQFGLAASCGFHLQGVDEPTPEPKFHPSRAKVYDILNVGKHNRFTVSGKLVHNCGYGGSVGALKNMGALELGLTEDELQPLVDMWRESNPRITAYWWDVDTAAKKAIEERLPQRVGDVKFTVQSGMLFITLPSGRRLAYAKPRLEANQFGSESITYEGIGGTKKWERLETYGPKLVENIVQAISRDILCHAMQTLSQSFITMHIHDELVIEAGPEVELKTICEQMGQTPSWASGLKLRADGYETPFYKKD